VGLCRGGVLACGAGTGRKRREDVSWPDGGQRGGVAAVGYEEGGLGWDGVFECGEEGEEVFVIERERGKCGCANGWRYWSK